MKGTNDIFNRYMDMVLSSEDDSFDTDDDDFETEALGEEFGIYREDYFSKEDYLEAIEEAKYSWREDYDYDFDTGIDPDDYETEEEFLEALEETCQESTKPARTAPKITKSTDSIYDFCTVVMQNLGGQSGQRGQSGQDDYLTGNLQLNLGEKVLVPFGNNSYAVGTVTKVGKCFESALPCDISRMKYVTKRVKGNALSCEGDIMPKDKLVFEDENIKIELVEWGRDNFLLGGKARTGTFIFENKSDKRLCMYMKDISVGGFLNIDESAPVALSGKQKEMQTMPFVYDNKVPDHMKNYKSLEFKVCYGTIREGFSSISFIDKPATESEVISMRV